MMNDLDDLKLSMVEVKTEMKVAFKILNELKNTAEEIKDTFNQYDELFESSHQDNTLSYEGKNQIFRQRVKIAAIERSKQQEREKADAAIESRMVRSIFEKDKSSSDFNSGGTSPSCDSSTCSLKKLVCGGTRDSESFDANATTPLAPTDCHGVFNCFIPLD